MKIFAYILSFFILALTVNPCIDRSYDNTLQKLELSQSTNNDNHHTENDHCSPFCSCQCCQINCYVSNIIALAPIYELIISYSELTSNSQSGELFDFFIPPKA